MKNLFLKKLFVFIMGIAFISVPCFGRITPSECYNNYAYELDTSLAGYNRSISRCAGNKYCLSEAQQSYYQSVDNSTNKYCACVLWCL